MYGWNNHPYQREASFLWSKAITMWESSVRMLIAHPQVKWYRGRYTGANLATGFVTIAGVYGHRVGIYRVRAGVVGGLSGLAWSPADDSISLKTFDYVSKTITPAFGVAALVDIIQNYSIEEARNSPSQAAVLRQLLSVGDFVHSTSSTRGVVLIDKVGSMAYYSVLPMPHPTGGWMWEANRALWVTSDATSDIGCTPYGVLPLSIFTLEGVRNITLGLTGARRLFTGKSTFFFPTVSRDQCIAITGQSGTDSETVKLSVLESLGEFRG
jgi:hypothetical protein